MASNVSTLSEGTNVIISNFKEDGSEGWTLNYNGSSNLNDYPISMILDEDGFLYIAGITQQFLGNYDIFLLKIDFSGTLIWEYTYGSTYEFDDFVTGLKLDSKKNIYLCGTTSITSANYAALLLKVDDSGNHRWDKIIDIDSLYDGTVGLEINNEENYIYSVGYSAINSLYWNYVALTCDSNGVVIDTFTRNMSYIGFNKPVSIKKDHGNGYYIAGMLNNDSTGSDVKLVKLDSLFNLVWVKTIDYLMKQDAVRGFVIDGDNNVYLANQTSNLSYPYRTNLKIVKVSPYGNILCRPV